MNSSRPFATLALILAALALLLSPVAWAQRVALVVGNAAYADRPLRNPVNDAQLMQTTLRELGFQVQVSTNVDRRGLLSALREFEARARGAEVALFYFAGHGAQIGGANYLIPVNAPIRSETDVPDEAVDAYSVLRRIEEGRARVGLVILDACRDNPFPGSARSTTRGLARMSAPTGSIVAYATAPGSTAEDGTGDNGTYTAALARYLSMPGLDIKEVFDRTAQEVDRVTNGKQRPREEVGLRGRFVLNDTVQGTVAATVTVVPSADAGGVSLADLEREAQARRQWVEWQQRMQADFDRIDGFREAPDLRVQAWQRFLRAWREDNPTGALDERLRERAQQQLADSLRELQALNQQQARLSENDSFPVPSVISDAESSKSSRYIIQVAAFADLSDVLYIRDRIERLGASTYTQAIDTASGRRIRVRIGPFVSREDANRILEKLRQSDVAGGMVLPL